MLPLSEIAKLTKNSLTDTGSWLILLDLVNGDEILHLRICTNTDDVVWDGNTYVAFPFDLAEISEASRGELPTFGLKVSNVKRTIQGYVEGDPEYGSGWAITLRVVHSANLINLTPEIILNFTTLGVLADENFVTFTLGMPNPIRQQFPHRKYMSDTCQHVFKVGGCDYGGADTFCGRTLVDCRLKFPGATRLPALLFPGIPTGAVYK